MRAYFFCTPPGPPEASGYEHGLVALAEGLSDLGWQVFGDRNLWPVDNGWLIEQTPEPPEAFDLVLISHESYHGKASLPEAYVRLVGPKKVYVDQADGWRTEASTAHQWPADLVLRAHYNRHFRYPDRVRPWAFGLTKRIIDATKGGLLASERPPTVLCNFRVGHPVRDRLTAQFRTTLVHEFTFDDRLDSTAPQDPDEYRLWALTGRRHNQAYYARLKQAQGCLAFGGFFAPGWPSAAHSQSGRIAYKAIQTLGFATKTLTQFDSWRLWESWAAGTVTVHAPLESWGAVLPVPPVDGLHYVAFDSGDSPKDFLAKWSSCLAADAAQSWAIDNYSPVAQASRLLQWLAL